jgi:F0F1-type ATP synthase membrane subunit b/b'
MLLASGPAARIDARAAASDIIETARERATGRKGETRMNIQITYCTE